MCVARQSFNVFQLIGTLACDSTNIEGTDDRAMVLSLIHMRVRHAVPLLAVVAAW